MSEERFRLLIEHAPVCIHEIDLQGRLTSMNPAGLRMMGVEDEAEIRGMPYLDAVGEDDRERIAGLLDHALHHGEAHFEFRSTGENPRHFASNFIPVRNEQRELIKLIGVTQDVTQQRLAEEALRALNRDLETQVAARTVELRVANRHLTERNTELDEFARAVSHDLKSPLMAISGFADLLEVEAPGLSVWTGRIAQVARRMGRMIDELLQLARAGEIAPNSDESVDLEAVLAQVCLDLAPEVRACDAAITHDPLPTVTGSRTEQLRLLQNLIGNALKFRGPAPPAIHVSAELTETGWEIAIADNGLGIPADKHEEIFRVFTRLHLDANHPGTGIGLAICKKLVGARGGTLRVRSAPGQGSTFTYSVPLG
jgi:PAS domain S-box-containing protein